MKLILKRLLFLGLLYLTACRTGGDGGGPGFYGPWADHARNAWLTTERRLEVKGIDVRPFKKVVTKFERAVGTLGRGNDRFPYMLRGADKLGGFAIGECNGNHTMTLAKEADGFWNVNIGTHEIGHGVNNFARCGREKGSHPDYMRTAGGMPHWPYWNGRQDLGVFVLPLTHTDTQGNSICVMLLLEPGESVPQSVDTLAADILSEFLAEQRMPSNQDLFQDVPWTKP